jgi:hypothetical protein
MVTSGGDIRKFSIVLHEGNEAGTTEKVITGTRLEANRAKQQMEKGLSEGQRTAGWWYEVREERPESVRRHPADPQRDRRRHQRDRRR